jgi:CheY-like chemotaxis protein
MPGEPGYLVSNVNGLLISARGEFVFPEKEMPLVALVVDDSMLIRHTVCRFLEERGFAVEAASNGLDALEALKRIHPDLIVTDMQMPKMGGSELITVLKSQPGTKDIPVVIVAGKQSGFEETEHRADFAIFKDIDIEEQLAKALQVILGVKAEGKAAAE